MIEPTFKAGESAGATATQARKTACVVAAVLLAVAAWQLYRGRTTAVAVLGGLGLALVAVGFLAPPLALRFHIFWMKVAAVLGYVNSRVLLTLMYYGVFTPYRLGSRLARRDPLNRRAPARESYWVERKRTRQAREQFERLF